MTRRALSILAACLLAACDSPSGPERPGAPARLDIVSGDDQSATVGTELAQPLVVRVLDAEGDPVPNQVVNFRVISGGGAVFAGAALTNAGGEARERWTLGTVAGDTQRVEARAIDPGTGQPLVFGTFTAVGAPDDPAAITPTGPQTVTGAAGDLIPLEVRVADRYGNPVPGATVVWMVQSGGGSITPGQVAADTLGLARAAWTLGFRVDSAQVAAAFASPSLSTQFTAAAAPPAGAHFVKLSGDAQTTTAGSAFTHALIVRFQGPTGQPIRGAPVTWSTASGTITPASAVTDAQGQASATWHPGTAAGVTTATVSTGGASIAFTGQVVPAAPAVLEKRAGDGESGDAGQTLRVQAAVEDQYGNPVAGETVTWRVVTGGGSVAPATSVTGSNGVATTQWTLGGLIGTQTLEAASGALAPVTFQATAASPAVRIANPAPGSRVGDTFLLQVNVVSPQEVTGVRATVAGRVFDLAFSAGYWSGTISLAGLPRGSHQVLVEARSAGGPIGAASATYIHDTRPVVAVQSPVDLGVATPSIRLLATCGDDDPDGCTRLRARVDGSSVVLAEGTSQIDATVSLAAYAGQQIRLLFVGHDSAGQSTTVSRRVYVETSPAWTHVTTVPGVLFDFHADRLLYADSLGLGAALKIRTRGTGADQTIHQAADRRLEYGYLSPRGAIFVDTYSTTLDARVRDWHGGVLETFGMPNSRGSLQVAGRWAAWNQGSGGGLTLIRRDLQTGTNVQVSDNAGNTGNDVADNGDVVFWDRNYDVLRYRGGTLTPLTSPADSLWNTYPQTDGINVVYRKHTPCCRDQLYRLILVQADGSEVELTERTSIEPNPGIDYRLNSGWVAFTRPGPTGVRQVWRRAPDGTESQLTTATQHSLVRSLGPNGEVVFARDDRRYAVRPGGVPVDIGFDWGRLEWIGGDLYVALASSIFRIDF